MTAARRVSILYLLCIVCVYSDTGNYEYNVTIEAFTPTGLRISIPDDPRIKFCYIEYSVGEDANIIREFIYHKTNGFWVLEKRDSKLNVGDLIRWTSFVALETGQLDYQLGRFQTKGVLKPYQNFKIKEVVTRKNLVSTESLHMTVTQIQNKEVTRNTTIFMDDFDTRHLQRDVWTIEHYIPVEHPEHPFISYQDDLYNPTILVENGMLHIRPLLQQNLPNFNNETLYSGTLDLRKRCTGSVCWMKALGPQILPPVVSGRISSRFSFKYGTVEIRAKLPRGDWIYPEILLEPKYKKYGSMYYASGLIKIAMSRGNIKLSNQQYDSTVLMGGPILNSKCKGPFHFFKKTNSQGSSWTDEFHVYSVTWARDSIQVAVDGQVWVTYKPGSAGLRSWLPKSCKKTWYRLLDKTEKIAPFNSEFYISIGLAVGGSSEFPDGLVTGSDTPKPWKNGDPKSSVSFWEHQNDWWPTWTQPELIVDYVKVTSI